MRKLIDVFLHLPFSCVQYIFSVLWKIIMCFISPLQHIKPLSHKENWVESLTADSYSLPKAIISIFWGLHYNGDTLRPAFNIFYEHLLTLFHWALNGAWCPPVFVTSKSSQYSTVKMHPLTLSGIFMIIPSATSQLHRLQLNQGLSLRPSVWVILIPPAGYCHTKFWRNHLHT